MLSLQKNFALRGTLFCLSLLFFVISASAQHTTIAHGNWSDPAIWSGGVPDTTDVESGTTITINHFVFFDLETPIKNFGTIRIERLNPGPPARLTVPTNTNVENLASGQFYVIGASFIQCRFVPCNDGQTYSGVNPGVPIQSGTFKNIGGYVEVKRSIIEVAQDWTNESGGMRLMEDSCIFTGQNFSVTGNSTDTLTRVAVSIGWHASGNFTVASSTISFSEVQIQLAGSSGNVTFDSSSTISGDIDYITLKNQIGNFIGTGVINANAGVTGTVNLDRYCVTNPNFPDQPSPMYISNGKFTGTQTPVCNDSFFACTNFVVTAGEVSVQGRVVTAEGRGVSGAVVTVFGGSLTEPIKTRTSSLGYFTIEGLDAGKTYFVSVTARRHQFSDPIKVISSDDNVTGLNFVADSTRISARRPVVR